jgi:hypothetical protein
MKTWLSLKAVSAEYADISERKLRQFIAHPTHPLPVRRMGGKWWVNRCELDEWFASYPRAGEDLEALADDVVRPIEKRVDA